MMETIFYLSIIAALTAIPVLSVLSFSLAYMFYIGSKASTETINQLRRELEESRAIEAKTSDLLNETAEENGFLLDELADAFTLSEINDPLALHKRLADQPEAAAANFARATTELCINHQPREWMQYLNNNHSFVVAEVLTEQQSAK